jgi:uncharacterized protein YjbI with pentapeptide repeats
MDSHLEEEGKHANLSDANLRGANLSGAYLYRVDWVMPT